MKTFLVLMLALCAYGQDYFYRITTKDIQSGSNYEVFVKSNMDLERLNAAIESGKMIVFPQTYAYLNAEKRWGTWSEWDDLFTGVYAIRGSDILIVQPLSGEPTLHNAGKHGWKDAEQGRPGDIPPKF